MPDEHHGIPVDKVDEFMAHLGIAEHTDEDCHISSVLYSALGVPVVAHGQAVWIDKDNAWVRYRIDAGTRRRLLVGNAGELTLKAWAT